MINETKIYVADTKELADNTLFEKMYRTVSAERQNKIDRLQLKNDKLLSLAAELLLKKALSDYGIVNYEICCSQNGKPYISNREDVFFNLSHSHERVMCAVSSHPVGCDVEKADSFKPKIAERFFCASEYNSIMQKNKPEEQSELFFRLWTLKESFIKATGLGMKLPFNSFCIDFQGNEIAITQSVDSNKYYFKEFNLNDGYKYAVCSLCPDITDIKQEAVTE